LIGIVLAAGAGRRLRPVTNDLPKALAPVNGATTILDFTLRNLADVGITDVVVVVGFAAQAIQDRKADLEQRYGLRLELVFNEKAEEWNNCYSLWCARDHFAAGVLLANGDTLHPVSVENTLLAAAGDGVVLALDDVSPLAEEQMKVRLDSHAQVSRITKQMPADEADGEYIGVAWIGAGSRGPLTKALEDTWRRNPDLYYEDAFQLLAERGHDVSVAAIGDSPWTEVDDHADLARARDIACLLS